jgi:hypothetical protein
VCTVSIHGFNVHYLFLAYNVGENDEEFSTTTEHLACVRHRINSNSSRVISSRLINIKTKTIENDFLFLFSKTILKNKNRNWFLTRN